MFQVEAEPAKRARSLSVSRKSDHSDERRCTSESRLPNVVVKDAQLQRSFAEVAKTSSNEPKKKDSGDVKRSPERGEKADVAGIEGNCKEISGTKTESDKNAQSATQSVSKLSAKPIRGDKSELKDKSKEPERKSRSRRSEDADRGRSSTGRTGRHYCGICGDCFMRISYLLHHLRRSHNQVVVIAIVINCRLGQLLLSL